MKSTALIALTLSIFFSPLSGVARAENTDSPLRRFVGPSYHFRHFNYTSVAVEAESPVRSNRPAIAASINANDLARSSQITSPASTNRPLNSRVYAMLNKEVIVVPETSRPSPEFAVTPNAAPRSTLDSMMDTLIPTTSNGERSVNSGRVAVALPSAEHSHSHILGRDGISADGDRAGTWEQHLIIVTDDDNDNDISTTSANASTVYGINSDATSGWARTDLSSHTMQNHNDPNPTVDKSSEFAEWGDPAEIQRLQKLALEEQARVHAEEEAAAAAETARKKKAEEDAAAAAGSNNTTTPINDDSRHGAGGQEIGAAIVRARTSSSGNPRTVNPVRDDGSTTTPKSGSVTITNSLGCTPIGNIESLRAHSSENPTGEEILAKTSPSNDTRTVNPDPGK